MERLTLEQAEDALPRQPQRDLAALGFRPAVASLVDGPVLRFTDGHGVVAELMDAGGAVVAFESLLPNGTLIKTAPPDPRGAPPRWACDLEVHDGSLDERLHRHRERSEGCIELEPDLVAGLPEYAHGLTRSRRGVWTRGVIVPAVLASILLFPALAVDSLAAVGVWSALMVLLSLSWAFDRAEQRRIGTTLDSLFGFSGLENTDEIRAIGRDFRAQQTAKRVASTRTLQLEREGFVQVDAGEGVRYHRGRIVAYRRSTHLHEDGRTLLHVLERAGAGKWSEILQSMHADVVVETVVGRGMPGSVVSHYRCQWGSADLPVAMREHKQFVGERRTVLLTGRDALVRGLARLAEDVRGERALHKAVRLLQYLLGFLILPYLGLTNLPPILGIAVIAFLIWAARELARSEMAWLGTFFQESLPEITPKVIEHLGRKELVKVEPKKKGFNPWWRFW